MQNLAKLLTSKKFLVALAGCVAVVLSDQIGMPEADAQKLMAIVVAYLCAQGIADHGKEREAVAGIPVPKPKK